MSLNSVYLIITPVHKELNIAERELVVFGVFFVYTLPLVPKVWDEHI